MKLFGEKKDGDTVKSVGSSAPDVVVSDASVRPRRFKKIPPGALIVIAVLVLVGGIGYHFWQQRPVRVGNHNVSKQDVSDAVAAQKRAMLANGTKNTSGAEKEAQKQVVLLAGLKTEADKRGIPYAESNVDTILKDSFSTYGTKDKYLSYMKTAYGWNREDVYRTRTIEYLEQKLQSSLLSTRSYALTIVRWDNIKINFPSTYQKVYDEKENLLKTKYLPLYQQKASTNTLSEKAELINGLSQDQQFAVFQNTDGIPVTYTQQTFGPGHSIDGIEKYAEGEDMATKLTSLKHIGDFTGPFKSNDGTIAIVRLESSTGGSYASWDAFTKYYQKQSGLTFSPSDVSQSAGIITSGIKSAVSVFKAQVAEAAAADCPSSHGLNYYIEYRDADTNALIAAANTSVAVSTDRSTNNCTKPGYTSRGYTVTNVDSNTFKVTKTFADNNAGTLHVLLDCNGPSYNISNTDTGVVVAIAGYNYVSTTYASGYSNAYPFFVGANGSGAFTTVVKYRKPPPPPPATSSITCTPLSTTSIRIDYSWSGIPSSGIDVKRTSPAATLDTVAASSGRSSATDTGLTASTSYTYTLNHGNTQLDTATCSTKTPSSASITCSTTSDTSISVSYSWSGIPSTGITVKKDGTDYTSATGSSGSGGFFDNGNAVGSAHTYDIYHGATKLDSASCTTTNTVTVTPSGSISCSVTSGTNISVSYSWSNTPSTGVTVKKDGTDSTTGSGTSGSGSFGDSNAGGTSHSYDLYNGSSLLSSASCTLPPPPAPPDVTVGAGTCLSGFDVSAQDSDSPGSELSLHITSTGYDSLRTTSGHSSHVIIPASFIDGSRHYFNVTAYGVNSSGTPDGVDGHGSTNILACGNFNVSPTTTNNLTPDDEAPTGYQVGGTVTVTSGLPSVSFPMSCSQTATLTRGGSTSTIGGPTACNGNFASGSSGVGGPSGAVSSFTAGDQYCATIKVQYSSGVIQEDGALLQSFGPQPGSSSCDFVTNKPFFKVVNSSVAAGGQVGQCTATAGTGTLSSWFNNNSGSAYSYGGSAQLGAYALAHIAGFASNQTNGLRSPTGLTFANTPAGGGNITTDSTSPYLGGSINGNNCITAAAVVPNGNPAGGGGNVNLASDLSGPPSTAVHNYTGNVKLTIPSPKVVKPGANIGIYVTGDVYIGDDIVYDLGSTWTMDTVPSMVISATGNIYIDASVKQLDGTYEAGGSIFTCATGGVFAPVALGNLYSSCANKLTITGSFVAKKVNFLRTYGSLRDESSPSGLPPASVTCNSASGPTTNQQTCGAEVFTFSPEQYLEHPAAKLPGGGALQYDAITSLPPVL